MAFTTPQRPGRWRNSRGVVASGTSKGATPTNEGAHRRRVPDLVLALAVGEAEARATPRACTRSPTLGLPIAGSAPLAPASALRASPARASQASQGQDSEGRSGNRGRLVPRFRPMPISASENANCVMRIPPA